MPDDAGAVAAPEDALPVIGDVPDTVRRRYLTDRRGGRGLGYYVDATIPAAAFRDEGRRLTAARNDPQVARDLVAIAVHRRWSTIHVQGSDAFRREVWLAGAISGLEVTGYRPVARDLQDAARRLDARRDSPDAALLEAAPEAAADLRAPAARMRVVEAVVRNRIGEPAEQERILDAARQRLAAWLEQGLGTTLPENHRPDRSRTR